MLLFLGLATQAQNVAINEDNSTADPSAILDIKSTTKGLLIPRMTTTQRENISSPAEGLLVYDIDLQGYYYYKSTAWVGIGTSGSDNLGNHTATLNLQLNNHWLSNDGDSEGIRIDADGKVGIATTTMYQALNVNGLMYASTGIEMGGLGRYIGSNLYYDSNWKYRADGEGWLIRHGNGGLMEFYTASSGTAGNNATIDLRMAIENTGHVGIGLSNPIVPLHVRNTTDLSIGWTPNARTTVLLEGTSTGAVLSLISGNTGQSSVWFGDSDLENNGRLRYEHDVNTMEFWVNNGIRMTIDANGNVGIGDNTPAGPLEVRTSSTITEALISQFTAGDGRTLQLLQPDNSDVNDYFTFLTFNALQFRVDAVDALSIEADGSVKVGPYTLPKIDGTNGQVLTTNGSGTVTWGTPTGDNLGDHIATTNLRLNGNYLSNDGDNEGIYVATNGNVGIGTNAPAGLFDVRATDGTSITDQSQTFSTNYSNSTGGHYQTFIPGVTGELTALDLRYRGTGSSNIVTVSIYEGSGTGGTLLASQSVSFSGSSGAVIARTINFSGVNLVIGTTYSIHLSSATNVYYANFSNAYPDGSFTGEFGDIYFVTYMTVSSSFTVTSSGVGINNTSPSVALDITGDIEYTGTITDVSDRRLKAEFRPIRQALSRVKQLKGFTYHMKNDPKKVREYGVIAQEVQKLFPEMVKVIDPEKGHLGVSYIQLVPVLLEAVKAQDDKITAVEKENKALKTQLRELEALKKQVAEAKVLKARLEKIEAILNAKAKK
ncbi:MAG TPA: hypothetical protein DCS93_19575 [Microscillaceae bacterium]|nr:hypothetical protein [Microscillaceae bacterium]